MQAGEQCPTCGNDFDPMHSCKCRKTMLDEVAHDEQLVVWAEEMECDLECFIVAPESYDDGVDCNRAFKAAIRDLAEKVIDRVLSVQATPTK